MKKINKPTDATKMMLDRIISWEKDLSQYESLEGILREQFIIYERNEGAGIINELLDSHNERVEEEESFKKFNEEHEKAMAEAGGDHAYLISQGVDVEKVTENGVTFVRNLTKLLKAEEKLKAAELVIYLAKVPTNEKDAEKFYEALEQYNAIR